MGKRRDRYLTTAEVAEELQVCVETVTKLVRKGELKGIMVGSRWRIRKSDLEEFVAEREREWAARKGEAARAKEIAEMEAHRAEQKAAKERLKETRKRKKPAPSGSECGLQVEALRAAMASAFGKEMDARSGKCGASLMESAALSFDGQTMRIGVECKAGVTTRNLNLIRNSEAVLLAALFEAGVDNPRLRVGAKDALDMGSGLFLGEQNGNNAKPNFHMLENYIKDGFTLYARFPRKAGGTCLKSNLGYKDWRTGTSRFCSMADSAVRSRDDLAVALGNGVQVFSIFPNLEGLVCLSVSREGARNLRELARRGIAPALDLYRDCGLVYAPNGSALHFFKDRGDVLCYKDALAQGVKICGRGTKRGAIAAGSFLDGLWEGGFFKDVLGELPDSLKGLAAAIEEPAAADRPL